jgi:hypothetical protein
MSKGVKPKLKELGRQLLAHETTHAKPGEARETAVFPVCEKLRGPLGKLIGAGGFHALLSRALTLAALEVPSLRSLEIREDGSLKNFNDLKAKLGGRSTTEVEIILVAQLLGLLVTFIGEALTLRLVQDIWPNFVDSDFKEGQTQ